MDDFELPDDLKDEVEVVYLDDDEEIEDGMDDDFDEEIGQGIEDEIQAEIIDLSQLTFKQHKGSVFASDLSKDGTMAITGGEDDMAYLWNTESGEVLFECTGHKDSVTEVGFNHDNQFVFTGDMGGLIQVWNIKEKKLTWCYEGDDLEWLFWHHLTNVLIAGSQSGEVYIFQIPQGNCKVLPSHGTAANCGKLLPDGKKLLVGYGDGQVKLWDIKSSTMVWQLAEPKSSEINNLGVNADGTLVAVSPSAQIIKVADGKVANVLLTDHENEIESCDFNNELGIVATGALSGQICVWELGRHALRHQARIECSVTLIKFGKDGKLLIGATDGAIYVCDARTGLLVETLTGHAYGILSMSISHDGSFVLSTSDDGTAKIYKIKSD